MAFISSCVFHCCLVKHYLALKKIAVNGTEINLNTLKYPAIAWVIIEKSQYAAELKSSNIVNILQILCYLRTTHLLCLIPLI